MDYIMFGASRNNRQLSFEPEMTEDVLYSLAKGCTGPQKGFKKSGPQHSNMLQYPAVL